MRLNLDFIFEILKLEENQTFSFEIFYHSSSYLYHNWQWKLTAL